VTWLSDGKTLCISSRNGSVVHWDTTSGEVTRRLPGIPPGRFSVDGSLLAAPSLNAISLWETDTGRQRGKILAVGAEQSLAVGPDGNYRGSKGIDEDLLWIVETDDGEQLNLTPHQFAAKYRWKNDPCKVQLAAGQPADGSRIRTKEQAAIRPKMAAYRRCRNSTPNTDTR
jgi:hypothetical protein